MSGKEYCSNCAKSSDRHRWINFVSLCKFDRLAGYLLTLSSRFKLESFPATATGAKFLYYRAYYVLQQLIENNLSQTY